MIIFSDRHFHNTVTITVFRYSHLLRDCTEKRSNSYSSLWNSP